MQSLISKRPIHYEHLEKLGEGAFSTVYKALRRDSEFDIQQSVALKILKSEIAIDSWREEFRALERVQSDKCVRVIGWDVLESCPTLVLEWIDGITLGQIAKSKLTAHQIDEICLQISEGLEDIHRAGLIHGDLSLQNVMLTSTGQIKLLDFGLSKATTKVFTPEFAAPELFHSGEVTIAADFYSLGRLRECLERKSKLPISFTTKELLRIEPNQRQFNLLFEPLQHERLSHQKELATRVQQGERASRISHSPTVMKLNRQPGLIRNTLLLILTTAALGSASATYDNRDGGLAVRTTQWFELVLDGKTIGYSPLELNLKSNVPHTLEWKSANSQGQRTLTLKPGQNMVITDEFFK